MYHASMPSFRQQLRRLEREIFLAISNESTCCSVSVAQCHLLLEIGLRGPSSLSELSEALTLDASTLSRTVESCVQRGLVIRNSAPEDRRKVVISLGEDGTALCKTINRQCNAQFASVFSHIPADKHSQVMESVALLAGALAQERQRTETPRNTQACPCN